MSSAQDDDTRPVDPGASPDAPNPQAPGASAGQDDNVDSGGMAPPTASWILASDAGTSLNDLADAPVLESVGPYRITGHLGEGGMGSVFLAEQEEPIRRRVALKVIKSGMNTRTIVSRFASERQTLALMNHPNIAQVFDAGETEDGRPYFVMELVEGGVPITDYCDQKRLPLEKRLGIFVQVCAAVQHAHHKTIIHRDIKPSNILVSEVSGEPLAKVIDFGIARALDPERVASTVHTETGGIIGSPGYMSPEQTDTGNIAIDTRSDVYSLGALLYELLVGTLPLRLETLKSGNLFDMLRDIRERDPPTPSTRLTSLGDIAGTTAEKRSADFRRLRRQLRGDLDWITMKALEKEPSRRYASPADLASDIERFLAFESVSARPPSMAYRLGKFARRNRWQVLTVAGAAMLLLGLVAWSLVSRIVESRTLLAEGVAAWNSYEDLKSRDLRGAWHALNRKTQSWVPYWERKDELAAWQAWRDQESELPTLRTEAIEKFRLVYTSVAPIFSQERDEARRRLAEANMKLYLAASEGETIRFDPEFFRRRIRMLEMPEFTQRTDGFGTVVIDVTPPEATVYVFRYEQHSGRRLPLTYDLQSRTCASPFLRVWKTRAGHGVFRPGDRIVSLRTGPDAAPRTITSRRDLADVLREVESDAEVGVNLLREGAPFKVSWVPFPADRDGSPFVAGQVLDIFAQFGILFEGYPLEFVETSRLRRADAGPGQNRGGPGQNRGGPGQYRGGPGQYRGGPGQYRGGPGQYRGGASLRVELPRGNYLFVLRHDGCPDTRLPVSVVPATETARRVRLVAEEDIPDGYVHVPGGPFPFGGDDLAYRSADRGEADIGDFFMKRIEVTYREYLTFINHPDTLARLAASRKSFESNAGALADLTAKEREKLRRLAWRSVAPLVDWTGHPVARLTEGRDSVQLLPAIPVDTIVQRDAGDLAAGFMLNPNLLEINLDSPAIGVPVLAALEYAHWLTERSGSRWRFRLPTDLEWEKAARGSDRRKFVWGDYPLYAFANTQFGIYPGENENSEIDDVAVHPMDESVYGVLDMTGCAKEPVLSPEEVRGFSPPTRRFCTVRGASWDTTDPRDPRVASRNRCVSYLSVRFVGFRLVAEPAAEGGSGPR